LTPEELDAIKQKIMDSEEDRMKIEILPAADQLVAAAANGIYQGIIVTLVVALCLRLFGRTNAATRHAVWFCTLLLVASLIIAHCWRGYLAFRAPDDKV